MAPSEETEREEVPVFNPRAALQVLIARVDRIEARQRAHSMHDPDCPVFRARLSQADTPLLYIQVPDCECWLRG